MRCPQAVEEPLLEILYRACIAIRSAAGRGDARYCEIEADHVHNVPGLIQRFDAAALRNYLDLYCRRYEDEMKSRGGGNLGVYKPLWGRLEKFAGGAP